MEKENRPYYKKLAIQKPFSRDSVPYPDRGMIPLYPHLQKHFMFLRYRGKGAVPPRQGGGACLYPNFLKLLYPRTNIVCAKKSDQGHDALVGVLGAKPPRSCPPKVLYILLVVAEVFQQEITIPPILLHLHPKL